MRPFTHLSRGGFCLLAATVATALCGADSTTETSTVNLSGDYEDGGTVVSASSDFAGREPSLAAMLQLVFDAKIASALHDQTARVTLKQTERDLDIEIRDRDDTVAWHGHWRAGAEYQQQGAAIVLRFRRDRPMADEVFITLEPAADNRLLQLTVQRVEATVLGPSVRDRGTYLFGRVL